MTENTNNRRFRFMIGNREIAVGAMDEVGPKYADAVSRGTEGARLEPLNQSVIATVAQVAAAVEEPTTEDGLAVPPSLAIGATVDGSDRVTRSRFEHMPALADAARAFREQIRAEERRDKPVKFGDLAFAPNGGLYNKHGDPSKASRLEPRAFSQLCAKLGIGNGREYLLGMDPERRAHNLTADLARAGSTDAVLRCRRNKSGRYQIMAVVSPRYRAFDGVEVLRELENRAAPDSKGLVLYKGDSWKICAFDPNARPAGWEGGRADAGSCGVMLKGDDTGHGSIQGGGYAFRFVCSNGMVLGSGDLDRKVHLGRHGSMQYAVREMIRDAYRDGGDFGQIYTEGLTAVPVDALGELQKVETYLQSLAVAGKREELVPSLQRALAWEEQHTGRAAASLTNIANAITRVAHTERSGDNVTEWEQSATKYLRRGLFTAAA
jgi:hypothetical protein